MAQLMTLPEINSALIFCETTYPSLCERIELPHRTAEGRTSYALRIGLWAAPAGAASLILGGVHAREWGGPDIVVSFASDILKAYSEGRGLQYQGMTFEASDIKCLIERTTIIVFPCVNPDGYVFSRTTDAIWRKNRNPRPSGVETGHIGVDINRNYDFLWDFKKHFHPNAWDDNLASEDPRVWSFHGAEPFSEPETRNVKALIDMFPNLGWFLDLHSFAGDVLLPWGDAPNQTEQPGMSFTASVYDGLRGRKQSPQYGEYISGRDALTVAVAGEAISSAMNAVSGRPYVAKQISELYPVSGSSSDYAFSRWITTPGAGKIYGFAIEFNFASDADPYPFFITEDPAVLVQTLTEVVPGLIAFALLATKHINLDKPERPIGDASYVNVLTGDSWTMGPGGLIHHPPPPDWYVTDVGREIGRLLASHESLSQAPGKAGEHARAAILASIEEIARDGLV